MMIFFWLMFTILVGVMASKRNRSVVGWVVGSFFISPLIAMLFLLALGNAGTKQNG